MISIRAANDVQPSSTVFFEKAVLRIIFTSDPSFLYSTTYTQTNTKNGHIKRLVKTVTETVAGVAISNLDVTIFTSPFRIFGQPVEIFIPAVCKNNPSVCKNTLHGGI
jgi:hypothetical protein